MNAVLGSLVTSAASGAVFTVRERANSRNASRPGPIPHPHAQSSQGEVRGQVVRRE